MSKLIKLSDVVGEALSKRAAEDNLSMAGEVAKLLSVTELTPSPVDTSYFDKKFDELKALIEDTAVDRLDRARPSKLLPSAITWENCLQDVYFDFPDDDPVWLPKVKEAWGESDSLDQAEFSSDGSYIYDVTGGERMPVLNITPALRDYLKGKGFEV